MAHPRGCIISVFRTVARYQLVVGALCLFILALLVAGTSESCGALEAQRVQGNHFHPTLAVIWGSPSAPHLPLGNDCSCASAMGSCCMDPTYDMSNKSIFSLRSIDDPRPLPPLQVNNPRLFGSSTLGQRGRSLGDFNVLSQEQSFLVNCALLF